LKEESWIGPSQKKKKPLQIKLKIRAAIRPRVILKLSLTIFFRKQIGDPSFLMMFQTHVNTKKTKRPFLSIFIGMTLSARASLNSEQRTL